MDRTIEEYAVTHNYQKSYDVEIPYAFSKMTMDHQMMPVISITRTRRCSVSSPLRFTRTFSEDSLDSLEKNGRKELRRQRIMEHSGSIEKEKNSLSPICHTVCPHLGQMGRSRTECPSETENLTLPLTAKRSAGDLSCPPSPTRRNLNDIIGLSAYQQKQLLQCWPNIFSTGVNSSFASSLFSTLNSKSAKSRHLFAKANGVASFAQNDMDIQVLHNRLTVELLDSVIRNLDADHSRITAYLTEIGRQHRHLKSEGLSSGIWDDMGDCIMECIRKKCEPVRKHRELRRAFLAVIAYITDNLKQGQSMKRASSSYDLNYSSESPKLSSCKKNSGM